MLADQIVRANRAAVAPPGGVGVREFADREFPNEDYHWVAAWLDPRPAPKAGRRFGWARFWRLHRSPGKAEPHTDPIGEPAPV
jgi:hypothetical protein